MVVQQRPALDAGIVAVQQAVRAAASPTAARTSAPPAPDGAAEGES
jgi:hypothetical protein